MTGVGGEVEGMENTEEDVVTVGGRAWGRGWGLWAGEWVPRVLGEQAGP